MNHSTTIILPAVFILFALALLISHRIKASVFRIKLSMIFYIIAAIATTLTSALGGSGMRKVEALSGVNLPALSNHARFGAISFILSIALLILAIRVIRKKENNLAQYFLLIISILFIVFYSISIYSSGLIL